MREANNLIQAIQKVPRTCLSERLIRGVGPTGSPAVNIVINGIGVAGPALAYWLTKSGHEVLLVEEAPRLRGGGYIIDFWGIGYDIAEKMGLIGAIRRLERGLRDVLYIFIFCVRSGKCFMIFHKSRNVKNVPHTTSRTSGR
jgi:NADPH-dependent 2,4-dienoyl-CoA reductase/sulfur reductase-like enzyme